MHLVGVQTLSLARLAYRDKSRGNTGSDGITWDKLSRKTIEARVRKRAPSKRIVEQRRKVAKQIEQTLEQAKQQSGKGSGKRRKSRGKPPKEKVATLRKKRKDLLAKHQALVDREFSKHAIGIDTGLQFNSSQPGFAATDGRGGNLLEVQGTVVTVGFLRVYSEHFDKRRKLMPETLPDRWQEELAKVVGRWSQQQISKFIKRQ